MGKPCCCSDEHLTEREVDVLCAIAAGMSSAQAAALLSISTRTVDHHIGAMLRRCGVRSRVDLVGLCYVAGILVTGQWPPQRSGQRCLRVPGPA
jgi:DNA-binding CsgD family transcriptional regulator